MYQVLITSPILYVQSKGVNNNYNKKKVLVAALSIWSIENIW